MASADQVDISGHVTLEFEMQVKLKKLNIRPHKFDFTLKKKNYINREFMA